MRTIWFLVMLVLLVGTWGDRLFPKEKKVRTVQCSTYFMDKARKVHYQFTDLCEVEEVWLEVR